MAEFWSRIWRSSLARIYLGLLWIAATSFYRPLFGLDTHEQQAVCIIDVSWIIAEGHRGGARIPKKKVAILEGSRSSAVCRLCCSP